MLYHFGGFSPHELHLLRERGKHLLEQGAPGIIPNPNHNAVRFFKRINRPAQAQVFRRHGKVELGELFLQLARGSDGKLRGNQDECSGGQKRERFPEPFQNEAHV